MARLTKTKILNALKANMGDVSKSADDLGVSRQAIYEYYGRNEDAHAEIDKALAEFIIDKVSRVLNQFYGNVKDTAGYLGKTRDYVYDLMDTYPVLADVRVKAELGAIETAESVVYKGVDNGDLKASMFLLRTKGRGRGWVTGNVTQLTGKDEKPVQVVINVVRGKPTDEG